MSSQLPSKYEKFKETLNPENPNYTSTPRKKRFSPENLEKSVNIAKRIIENYKKTEADGWYEFRIRDEERYMKQVADITRKNGVMTEAITTPQELFSILIAAQNLSLKGEKSFLEEMIKQPVVFDYLSELITSGKNNEMRQEAENNERQGKLNENGLPGKHKPTAGEIRVSKVNSYIDTHPETVRNTGNYVFKESDAGVYSVENGDTRAELIEILGIIRGRSVSKTINKSGKIVINIGEERAATTPTGQGAPR